MAKKSTGDPVKDMLKSGQLMKGTDSRLDIRRLPTGIPQLDAIVGGGIPYNRVVALVGPESTGKTAVMQYIATAVQKTERPYFLLMDMEKSYDRDWWVASGVDPDRLYVSQPTFGEEAIDIMAGVLRNDPTVGGVGLDSIPTMIPKIIMEADTAEDKFVGQHPVLIGRMLAVLSPLIHDVVFVHCNQMRANIGGYEEIYPGGYGLKHGTHLRLRTRREGWLKEGTERVGFTLEIQVPKNKVGTPYGECQIGFRFKGQMDLISSYIDEAVSQDVIVATLPYYKWPEIEEQWMGKANMRQFFVDQPAALVLLKSKLKSA